ncbi:Ig-like domain-containing protein [Rubripirellula amarantea]|uniref:Ig-like domain-containing protein n=1 Tax=Rubripirellula amarantea TaxID=2527999 RepID=UPI0013EF46DC|nr:Ig-like domain-containing protein [Rubripirellula amarantea]
MLERRDLLAGSLESFCPDSDHGETFVVSAVESQYFAADSASLNAGIQLMIDSSDEDDLYFEGHPDSHHHDEHHHEEFGDLEAVALSDGIEFYRANGRFTTTATDGSGLTFGDPATLTWGFVNDGTSIPGGAVPGEVTAPSDLIAFLGGIYGVTTNDTNYQDEPWFPLIESTFDRWEELSGVTYVYEPNDDGASFPGSPGVLGVRPDIRLSGHALDGNSNVLAYNSSPNLGDMVIDTTDSVYSNTSLNSRRLRTIVAHEHGHGLGLSHVVSNNASFLMEPSLNVGFDGPQLDDIYGIQRLYGDALEPNDSLSDATDLGVIATGGSIDLGGDATDTVVDISDTGFLTVDDQSDLDMYAFTIDAASDVTVTVTPVGPTYNEGPQGGVQAPYDLLTRADLILDLLDASGNVISSSDISGLGGAESINSILPQAGTYHAAISTETALAQFYELSIDVVTTPAVNVRPDVAGSNLREGGAVESYQLFLGTTPNGEVEVTATADDQLEISLDAIEFSQSLTVIANDETPIDIFVRAVDDNIFEGSHTGTIQHQITSTFDETDYPLSLSVAPLQVSIDDNELGSWQPVAPDAGQILKSVGNEGSLSDATDVRFFNFELNAGETLAVTAQPDTNETLIVEWLGVSPPVSSPAPGSDVVMTSTVALSTGVQQLKVTGSGATDFTLDAWRNAVLEDLHSDSSMATPLPLVAGLGVVDVNPNNAAVYGVIGKSEAAPGTTVELVQRSAPTEFVDLSLLPASNTFMLNNNSSLSTSISVGNEVFPAGVWKMYDNGSLIPTTDLTIPLFQDNTAIPNSGIDTAMIPFWDDLDASLIYYDEIVIDGIPAFVVQWQDRPHRSFGGAVTFQVQVFDSGPLLAKYAYQDVFFGNASVDQGASATVGFQSDSTTAVSVSTNSASLNDGDVVDVQFALEPDVDAYSIDWTGKVGTTVDVVLEALGTESYAGAELQIIGPDGTTVLASGVSDGLSAGVSTDHDLAIFDFVVPADGVYYVRLSAALQSEYSITVAESVVVDTEPNDAVSALRTVPSDGHAMGSLSASTDAEDRYSVSLAANETLLVRTATPLDQFESVGNSLDPRLTIIAPDQATVVADDADTVDGRNAEVVFTAVTAGVYTIVVQAEGGDGDYQLLSQSNPVLPGEVTVNLPSGSSNDVTVTLNGSDVEILDNSNGGSVLDSVALASAHSLVINGGNQDDTLTFDFSSGFFRFRDGIAFNDPSGTDELVVVGTGASGATYQSAGSTLGNASLVLQNGAQQSLIAFTGIEPIEVSNVQSFEVTGTLDVGSDSLVVSSATSLNLSGLTTIDAGGTLSATSLSLESGETITANGGMISARFEGAAGSQLNVTDDAFIGDAASPNGFEMLGELVVAGNTTLELLDSNAVELGMQTTLGGGGNSATVVAANGFALLAGQSVSGYGTLDSPDQIGQRIRNNGSIVGNSLAEPVTISGFLDGIGSLSNVRLTGTYSPGASPAQVSNGSVEYTATSNTLMEVGGLVPGVDHDQVNHNGSVTLSGNLSVSLIDQYVPNVGDSFTLMTATSGFSGSFNSVDLPFAEAGQTWALVVEGNQLDLHLELDLPIAVDDLAITTEANPVVVSVLSNDEPAGDLEIIEYTTPGNGAVVSNGDGTFTYTPDVGFTGTDSFDYTIAMNDVELIGSEASSGDRFGFSVDIDGDYAVVGAYLDDPNGLANAGSAFVYQRTGDASWTQVAQLNGDLDSTDAQSQFGWSVAIDGDVVVVAAQADRDIGFRSGAAYIFGRDIGGADNWGRITKIVGSDTAKRDLFGRSVDVSGNTVVVGASVADPVGISSGAAYVFERDHGGTDNWGEVKKLIGSTQLAGDRFGQSVSIDADRIAVGAFRHNGSASDTGAVYVFDRDQGGTENWGEVAALEAGDGSANDQFGFSVSVDGTLVAVGAPLDDTGGSNQLGSVYVFSRDEGGANNWGQTTKLLASDGAAGDRLGMSVAIDGSRIVSGAIQADIGGDRSGSAYLFENAANTWTQTRVLTNEQVTKADEYGVSIAIDGDVAVIGSWLDNRPGNNTGGAYAFDLRTDTATVWVEVDTALVKFNFSNIVLAKDESERNVAPELVVQSKDAWEPWSDRKRRGSALNSHSVDEVFTKFVQRSGSADPNVLLDADNINAEALRDLGIAN